MKVLKWGVLVLGVVLAGGAGYLFIGGKSPIAWSSMSYTDALAEASKSGKPVLIDFYHPL